MAEETEKEVAERTQNSQGKDITSPESCSITEGKKGWLKGWLPMAICCGAPLLLMSAIALFGIPLGAVAGSLLSLAAVLACPLGMYFMMRVMMNLNNALFY